MIGEPRLTNDNPPRIAYDVHPIRSITLNRVLIEEFECQGKCYVSVNDVQVKETFEECMRAVIAAAKKNDYLDF